MTSQKGIIVLKWQDFDQNTLEQGEDEASFNISSAKEKCWVLDWRVLQRAGPRRLSVQGTGMGEFFPFRFPTSNL